MPAIRQERWKDLFISIANSLESSDNFELIIVSPYNLPIELSTVANIKLITDYGSPTRCFNIALEAAEGSIVTWGADDATYIPSKLKKAVGKLEAKGSHKHIIALSQVEHQRVYDKNFCRINNHDEIRSSFVPDNFVLLPTAVMYTEFMRSVGGLDCSFQGHAMAHVDFAIRAQYLGATVEFEDDICLNLEHTMGPAGDHGPIHYSQLEEDEPLYRQMYSTDNSERIKRLATKENVANWKTQPSVWRRRFTNV